MMAKKSMKPKHEDWLAIADQDLYAAAKLLRDDDSTLAPSIFHTQQCAEKALKAYLAFNQCMIQKTHDLVKLLESCSKLDQEFTELLPAVSDLNPFAIEGRYPEDNFYMLYRPQVEKALNQAEGILAFVKEKIDSEACSA